MAKRFSGTKTLFDETNYKDILQFCESVNLPYRVTESNYTLKIESSFCNRYFLQNVRSGFCFAVGKMIIRDIKATGLVAPEVNKFDLKYFNFNVPDKIKKGLHVGEVYNIDIKSAYANVLYNHSLVSEKTLRYMGMLAKEDRLAAVGMLASHKEIFEILGTEVLHSYSEISDMRDWFYFCVNRTNEIMQTCANFMGNDFLHFWVDGIFFENKKHAEKVGNYLNSIGYKYSFETLTDYTYFEDNKGERVEYYKDGEKKQLFLPKKNSEVIKYLVDFLNLHNEK